ncbi:FHA domain-containing protein [Phototrophicus methaneseepsis]|uniref:FHA domain-containing protein n=1 Tax=Phototrophicus methaneseepsis TaxID=2710758 RepID=A0A7S8IDB0_9CHLR|nr:FHA domain-containing protein [Phototrophicus methaneseepsis]QPC81179.1 FHA domain-containing protein [Phototrophicus methaneseepsis]
MTTRVDNAIPEQVLDTVKWGSAQLTDTHTLKIDFMDTNKSLMLRPKGQLIFGRADESTNTFPDVDLAPYGAISKGVSRQHAVLEVNEDTIIIMDLGSSNGTFLNGQRLLPNQPRVVRDGDEVRLGRLVTHIHFK